VNGPQHPSVGTGKSITVEGFTADEIVALAQGELHTLFFSGEPLTFRVGTAEVLGQFQVDEGRVIVELAHIDGGGEGILPFLASIAERCAQALKVSSVEWIVYALTCAQPNSALRSLLERRGFTPGEVKGQPVLRATKPVQQDTKGNAG
jgi:hypothetical protein